VTTAAAAVTGKTSHRRGIIYCTDVKQVEVKIVKKAKGVKRDKNYF